MTTPAPSVLDENTISYVKNLIEANPRDEKLQGVIGKFKDLYPRVSSIVSLLPWPTEPAEPFTIGFLLRSFISYEPLPTVS